MSGPHDPSHHLPSPSAARRGFAIAGVVVSVVVGLARCSMREERLRALDRQLYTPAATPVPLATPVPDAAPVELEVVIGAARLDVIGASVVLDDGRRLELVPRLRRTYSSAGLSLTYPSSIRLTASDDGVMLGTGEVTAELAVIATSTTATEALGEMADGFEATGQIESSEAITYTLLGREVFGRRLRTAAGTADLLATPAGKGRQLRVIVATMQAGADLTTLRDALATVTLRARPATPELDLELRDVTGELLDRAPATIGTAVELDGTEVTIVRRAMVREQRAGLRFEHAAELTATTTAGAYPSVALESGPIAIQVFRSPVAIDPDDLGELGGAMAGSQPVTRTFAGNRYRGVSGELRVGGSRVRTLAFTFRRGGHAFVVLIQAPPDDVDRAAALAEPVIASVE